MSEHKDYSFVSLSSKRLGGLRAMARAAAVRGKVSCGCIIWESNVSLLIIQTSFDGQLPPALI
jgi:hypothetical protein